MASSVSFGKFEWSKAGYRAVMDSGEVQGMLDRKANQVKASADAMLSADGYNLPGHEVKQFEGIMAKGRVVRTKTDHARYANAKRNTLLKSLR